MAQGRSLLTTGLPGLDRALRGLLPGDNIVWRFDSTDAYAPFVRPFSEIAGERGRRLTYFRFGNHPPLLPDEPWVETHHLDPHEGFETFINKVHDIIRDTGRREWHVFDCLTDLAIAWRSDTMLSNFFVLTCPYIYDIGAIGYFGLKRNFHAKDVLASFKNTSQVFLDVYNHKEQLYVHPLKVLHRYSPTMYMLHVWKGDDFIPVTESSTTGQIMSAAERLPFMSGRSRAGAWHTVFHNAEQTLHDINEEEDPKAARSELLLELLQTAITRDPKMLHLLQKYISVEDVMRIADRILGTGLIGGKTVGMLLARAILRKTNPDRWNQLLEIHDSFYIGSDVFYTFLVQNGLWWEWQKLHASVDFPYGAEYARRKTVVGEFPPSIVNQFKTMLDYYGQSPIIVRSSSLLEDSFGHSFAGKYESVFLANQGSPPQRLEDFMAAVRTIYASSMSREALSYRQRRGMLGRDEQMALLVQRVSGVMQESLFFPHLAGVGFSYNPFVWSDKIDPTAGVIRLVFGMGTRAVDRTDDDYPRVVALNAPERRPTATFDDVVQYSQHRADVLDLQANQLVTEEVQAVINESPHLPLDLLVSYDERQTGFSPNQLKRPEPNRPDPNRHPILTFDKLLLETNFVDDMRQMLSTLEEAYESPVDIEFTTNVSSETNQHRINLVQCRPLQVQREGATAALPESIEPEDRILEAKGAIIGHSRICNVERIIYVVPESYSKLTPQERYSVARLVGRLTNMEMPEGTPPTMMLIGPGRWGTSMPSLGVPVRFDEISEIAVLCEMVMMHDNLVPDVSLGTHMFNELVEADILYMALFQQREENVLNTDLLEKTSNQLPYLLPDEERWTETVRVIDAAQIGAVSLNANTFKQHVVCYRKRK
ncbi:MAG: PEP/pyruvate-binding domain-containing protein [Planctomycetia bacterium]|jgi:hypothetical protein